MAESICILCISVTAACYSCHEMSPRDVTWCNTGQGDAGTGGMKSLHGLRLWWRYHYHCYNFACDKFFTVAVKCFTVASCTNVCRLFPLLKLKSRTSLLTEPGGSSLTRAPGGINGINIHCSLTGNPPIMKTCWICNSSSGLLIS